jgi:hypothetical protein
MRSPTTSGRRKSASARTCTEGWGTHRHACDGKQGCQAMPPLAGGFLGTRSESTVLRSVGLLCKHVSRGGPWGEAGWN